MHRCNYCLLGDFEKLAAQTGRVVTQRPHALGAQFPAGVDVYVHPVDYVPPMSRTGGSDPTDPPSDPPAEWWVAWLAGLSNQCACDT